MKKILVAGAGHGGIVAAAKLSKVGFEVTVIEKRNKSELGHDWEDRFTFSLLESVLGISESSFKKGIWRFRGDCAFVSPSKNKKVIINYDDSNRQKIMWRKPLINMLLDNAEKCGVNFLFNTEISSPIIENDTVIGLSTSAGDFYADIVIDAAGVFSPVRTNLPSSFGIEASPKYGDVFYGYRAYYNRLEGFEDPEVPFEVYLYHEKEKGLSWFNTYEDSVDILIGRIYELTDDKVNEQLEIFKEDHPWLGQDILHGGNYGIIPVRRPLTVMVANGYAAVGDSAFMTTPMNGMGIDLSILAGDLLFKTILKNSKKTFTADVLWEYNCKFHELYGGETAKNEGLKNALLSLSGDGADFLFEKEIIQSSDLAGAGKNMDFNALISKVKNGMKNPAYFMPIINGILKGTMASNLYKSAPKIYDKKQIERWSKRISELDIIIE